MDNKERINPIRLAIDCFFILLVTILGFAIVYLLYINMPGTPQTMNPILIHPPNLTNNSLDGVSQFYPNMKFNHKNISYEIDPLCSEDKKKRVIAAFEYLSNEVDKIVFNENLNSDIEISCSELKKDIEGDYFIAGEGGAREIVDTGRYNIINKGVISLYENPHGSIKCDWPNIELHELMHVFGFEHSTDKNSIMYPFMESCDQKLDSSIITELNKLYSEENLPDLYFEQLNVTKKGRYLDFNLTIRNSGSVTAKGVTFSILDEGKTVDTFNLDEVKYSGGIIFTVENFNLIHRNPSEIRFVIDESNKIKEIDEENNVAIVTFE
jgi:hypothetical protein